MNCLQDLMNFETWNSSLFFFLNYTADTDTHTRWLGESANSERREMRVRVHTPAIELSRWQTVCLRLHYNLLHMRMVFDWDHLPLACNVLFATGGTIIVWFTCCLLDDFLVTVIVDRFSAMGDDDTDCGVVVVCAAAAVLFGVNRLSKKNSEINSHINFVVFFHWNVSWKQQKVYEIENKQKPPFYESVCLCLFIEKCVALSNMTNSMRFMRRWTFYNLTFCCFREKLHDTGSNFR